MFLPGGIPACAIKRTPCGHVQAGNLGLILALRREGDLTKRFRSPAKGLGNIPAKLAMIRQNTARHPCQMQPRTT